MSLTRTIAERLNPVLRMMGAQLVGNKQLEHYQKVRDKYLPEIPEPGDLAEPPPEAREYLQIENPRLVELRQRYQQYKCAATSPSIWTQSHVSLIDLAHFRSDNPYVFQRFDSNGEVAHALTTYYLQRKDTLGLLERLREDRVSRDQTFDFESRFLVSRDLLDSINEINFLERTIGIASGTGFECSRHRSGLRSLCSSSNGGRAWHRQSVLYRCHCYIHLSLRILFAVSPRGVGCCCPSGPIRAFVKE